MVIPGASSQGAPWAQSLAARAPRDPHPRSRHVIRTWGPARSALKGQASADWADQGRAPGRLRP